MKGYTATAADGTAIHYVDRKRYLWLLSVVFPLQPLLTAYLMATTGHEALVFFPILLNYLALPLLDWLIGEDGNNPPDEVVMQLDRDAYYRRLTYLVVPLHFLTFVGAIWYATTAPLSVWAFLLFAATTGMVGGLAINAGHELGHKNSRFEKWLARMGESIYRFARREIPGAFLEAWNMEKTRLDKRGKSVWHADNSILQTYALAVLMTLVLLAVLGWKVLPFVLVHHAMAYWQLTSANYIEHYGLLRGESEDGKVERCAPHHSWNCSYLLSNLVLFHLERHSDHHTHPLRRYQSLRHYPELPQLPNGYFGMYLLAYVPFLWFKVMDARLMALPHVAGDMEKVNIERQANTA